MIIVELKKVSYVMEEPNQLLMYVMKNVETDEISAIINVMMVTQIAQMDVMEIVMQKQAGCVQEEIQEELSQLLIFVQKFVGMESIEDGIPVMTEIFKMEMDVLQTVKQNLALDVLGDLLELQTFALNFVGTD